MSSCDACRVTCGEGQDYCSVVRKDEDLDMNACNNSSWARWAGIAQWLEHRTRDWKVVGSNPCRSSGRIFFSRVDFLCWLLFRYPFHPRVTAVARKRSRSFCQKCRWQVTAKTHIHLTYVALHDVTWSMVVWCTQNLRRDGCSFMWHQPCQRCKYTTSVDIKNTRYKKLVTHVEPHASAVSLLKRAENSAI